MSILRNKRILIFQQRGWAINIGHWLAKKLQAEGCRLAAVTIKKTTYEFIVNQKEVKYDLVLDNDEVVSRPGDYLAGDDFSLEEICRELGINSVWPLVATLRNHVRSYKDKYYYSFKQNVPDDEIVLYIKAAYKSVKYVFDNFQPDFIIAPNFVSLPQIMFNLYADKKGIKMIATADSKIKGNFFFSYDYNISRGPFHERLNALNQGDVESSNREKARQYIKEFRENFKVPDNMAELTAEKRTFREKLRHAVSPFYHTLQWYLNRSKNVLDSTGITIDYRPPRIIFRDHYCHDRYIKFMNNYKYYPLEKIKKYAYFPLQFQPEESIDVAAPFFSNQIETARQIAMSLPGDYTLVVKEHPSMIGYRPPTYIEKVDRTVNVKLIDWRIPSEEVLKKCDLVVSPNSTTLAEAAFLGKPAIQLGNLGTTLKLPNVFKHTDMTSLAVKITEILKINLTSPEYERRLENYVAAAFDVGYNFDYFSIWDMGEKENKELLWQAYKKEIELNLKF